MKKYKMNNKKSQIAVEFLFIFVFVLIIITLIMYAIGTKMNDVQNQVNKKEIDNFAQSILTEIKISEKMQPGYSRKIKIENHFIKRFNLTINSNKSFFTITDTENQDLNKLELFYYEFKENTNISLVNETGIFSIYLYKNQKLNNTNSLTLI